MLICHVLYLEIYRNQPDDSWPRRKRDWLDDEAFEGLNLRFTMHNRKIYEKPQKLYAVRIANIFFYPHSDNRREEVAKYSNDTYFKYNGNVQHDDQATTIETSSVVMTLVLISRIIDVWKPAAIKFCIWRKMKIWQNNKLEVASNFQMLIGIVCNLYLVSRAKLTYITFEWNLDIFRTFCGNSNKLLLFR